MGYQDDFNPRLSPTRGEYLIGRKFSRRIRTLITFGLIACSIYLFTSSTILLPFFARQSSVEAECEQAPGANTTISDVDRRTSLVAKQIAAVKVGKVSMLYGNPSPHYERAIQSHQVHADRHHYPFSILRTELIDGIWSKPAYIMQLVMEEMQKPAEERLEWLFWADADTYIVNPLIPLDVFLPPASMDHIHMLVGNDHNGLNFGVFFIRVCSWTAMFMSDVLALRHYQPDLKLRFNEQSAVAHLLDTTKVYSSAVAIIPQRWVNAYMGPRHWDGELRKGGTAKSNSVIEGDLLIHFAGHSKQKKTRMSAFMNKQEEMKDVWQIEYEKTRYPKEIANFWRRFGSSSEEEQQESAVKEIERKVKEVKVDKKEDRDHPENQKEEIERVENAEKDRAEKEGPESSEKPEEASVVDEETDPETQDRSNGDNVDLKV